MKKVSKKQILIAISIIIGVLLIGTYIGFSLYFKNHFFFKTTINGVDASGKTVEEVESVIEKGTGKYTLELEGRLDTTEKITAVEIGLEAVFDGSLQKELEAQNVFGWFSKCWSVKEVEIPTLVTFDQAKLDKRIADLSYMQEENVIQPQNAYVSEYKQGVGYEIVPAEQGTKVDDNKLKEELASAIVGLKEKISLEEKNCYIEPEFTEESTQIIDLASQLNQYTKTIINYKFGSKKELLNGDIISQWLLTTEDYQVTVNDEAIQQYVKDLANKYNTAYKPKSFATSYGQTITIPEGDYGWKIDRETEKAELLELIKGGETIEREPAYSQRAASHDGNDYGNTYVEINLTAQHMYFYKDGSLLVESDFVSGNLSKGYDTPPGVFGLTYKDKDAVLRGEGYATPVTYWMPFNGNIGMHDASWRNGKFGGFIYKKSGSHGCVNMPPSNAKKVFENIESGMPVLVYYLPGTESPAALAEEAAAPAISAINAIGDVSIGSKGAIEHARGTYNGLNDTQKGYVNNYSTLEAAETHLKQLEEEQKAAQAAADAAKAQVEADKQAANGAINKINEIGSVTIADAETEARITNAWNVYNGLSEAQKTHVGNHQALLDADAAFKALKSQV